MTGLSGGYFTGESGEGRRKTSLWSQAQQKREKRGREIENRQRDREGRRGASFEGM